MWQDAKLVEDLQALGLREGDDLLVHVSLRAIGKIEGGAETLLNVLREVLGEQGTLLVPAFTIGFTDPAEWRDLPEEVLENYRDVIPVFDAEETPVDVETMGIFPEIVRLHQDSIRSDHPVYSFAALGPRAGFYTQNQPFHFPLGSDSPLARLHQMNGYVLLIGVDHAVNSSLHLSEVWSNVPYLHRSARVKTSQDRWTKMEGSPACSQGFGKIELVLRQARIIRRGNVGNAPCQLMRQRELISMGVAMLQGASDSLLCDDPYCPWCKLARKFTAEQVNYLEGSQ